jgi:hypothetical protein
MITEHWYFGTRCGGYYGRCPYEACEEAARVHLHLCEWCYPNAVGREAGYAFARRELVYDARENDKACARACAL